MNCNLSQTSYLRHFKLIISSESYESFYFSEELLKLFKFYQNREN